MGSIVLGMAEPSSPEFRERQGISLDELTQAYAEAMGGTARLTAEEDSFSPPEEEGGGPQSSEPRSTIPIREGQDPEDEAVEGGVAVTPASVVETLLFVGSVDNRPLGVAKAAELMRGVTPSDVDEAVAQLNVRYRSNGCPYEIVEEREGYRMSLRPAFFPVRNKFYSKVREARLSQAAIDALAIVAYRQPLTSEQVSQLRGTPSGHLLTQLVRRQLLEVERGAEGRQLVYRTSQRFLELFGLESLEDLPDSE
ncbi:MAG: SMC-Scp complex subunit ScpB [Planctomycetaceae bacterium]|nr:SMC-Scp complex subunit ScpB [Planctomycetaceae bacterium]